MNKWLLRIGVCLVVAALISISPIMDLLPVDGWSSIIHMFSGKSDGRFYKVVVGPGDYTTTIILAVTGISLNIIGKFSKAMSKKQDDM